MGDNDPRPTLPFEDENIPASACLPSSAVQSPDGAFHSQLQYLSHAQLPPQDVAAYSRQPFDMGALAGALPAAPHSPMNPQGQFTQSGGLSPAAVYQIQQASQYAGGRPHPMDSRTQQDQYMGPTYGGSRPGMQMQLPGQYTQLDPYGFGVNPMSPQQMDPRFGHPSQFGMPLPPDFPPYIRRASESAPVPSFPRGPPRKPKQSGHALWVGNLPPTATVIDLKDHFSRDATKDIESLFLISKSNCAFVNYRSETACMAAMNRFHDSRFQGVRLVCRLRRGTAPAQTPPSGASALQDTLEASLSSEGTLESVSTSVPEDPPSPTIVSGSQPPTTNIQTPSSGGEGRQGVAEKYFIVKSLTVGDLESSVRNGIWATQTHNEAALNRAFDEADTVYLIFSANKSGEYFGYARMTSHISGEPINLGKASYHNEPPSAGVPQSILTPATATAPKGRVIDDSARGTIFWEAEPTEDEEEETGEKETGASASGENWGRQFKVEWLSTARLPFYRTRGLRNPWNANREVKIARDGTELEPSVGRRLIQMFHRPAPGPAASQPSIPYR